MNLAAQPLPSIPESTLWVIFIIACAILFFGFIVTLSLLDNWRKVQQTRAREETRREVAAYVAEGSMTAAEAANLMAAGESIKSKLFGSDRGFAGVKIGAFKIDSCGGVQHVKVETPKGSPAQSS